jgi:hypothetical protein
MKTKLAKNVQIPATAFCIEIMPLYQDSVTDNTLGGLEVELGIHTAEHHPPSLDVRLYDGSSGGLYTYQQNPRGVLDTCDQ